MQSHLFGHMPDGAPIHAFTLGSAGGLSAVVTQYGGRLVALDVPVAAVAAKLGKRRVVLGFDRLEPYLGDGAHLGAITGRYANRIAGGRFTLDGKTYQLPLNNGGNTLHGGPVGFGSRVWHAEPDGEALLLTLRSADGDQGFPGTLDVQVRYRIAGDALAIEYAATCDAPTVVNLTNHAYFNLTGAGTVLDHVLHIAAESITPVNAALIPTGGRRDVAGTPLDFRTPTAIGARIAAPDEQMGLAGGYDHNFVLADAARPTEALAATLSADGIRMSVLTTEPGIQFYSGNFLNGSPFAYRSGLCLETQHFPDSPNQPHFPSTVLRPDSSFVSRTIFAFARQ
jgi:aldose 1-epimerase